MKNAQIIKFSNKQLVKNMFDEMNNVGIFYASHNPFLKETEYEIHITKKDQYSYEDLLEQDNLWLPTLKQFITVKWGEKGYTYLTIKRISNMIKKEYPELLI